MIPRQIEERVAPVVENFVYHLNGRYRKHCSDEMLSALLMYNLGNASRRNPGKTLAEEIVAGDHNAAYNASVWLFENILENKCNAGGNGHHVAQKFSIALIEVSASLPT